MEEELSKARSLSGIVTDVMQLFVGVLNVVVVSTVVLRAVYSSIDLYAAFASQEEKWECNQRVTSAAKRVFVDYVHLVGIPCSVANWAHHAKIISLGSWAPAFQGIGSFASILSSGIGITDSLCEMTVQHSAVMEAKDEGFKDISKQKFAIAFLQGVSYGTTLLTTSLTLAGLIAGGVVSSWVVLPLFALGFISWIAAFCWGRNLKQEEKV